MPIFSGHLSFLILTTAFILLAAVAVQGVSVTHVSGYVDCYNPTSPDCWPSCIAEHYKGTISKCGCNTAENDSFSSIHVTHEKQEVEARPNRDCSGQTIQKYTGRGCYSLELSTVYGLWIDCY
ncbi:MAG: hypothetical protein JOS17DRAFT_771129 [Linnemannia elongata]|nr:MAG: hypothetical protein JOS17DRAFT_771129 [Linnemannia elongata]